MADTRETESLLEAGGTLEDAPIQTAERKTVSWRIPVIVATATSCLLVLGSALVVNRGSLASPPAHANAGEIVQEDLDKESSEEKVDWAEFWDKHGYEAKKPDSKEAEMLDIINEEFKDVGSRGRYLESNVKLENTWEICGNIDWSKNPSFAPGTDIYANMEEELGISKYCKAGDPDQDDTCKAIFAAQKAMVRLQENFPEGPRFANVSITEWGKYPSFFEGSVGKISGMPPVAPLLKGNAANGWTLCDLVRIVLTESANQVGAGVCGWIASFGALSRFAPAHAIKMLVRLYWTGRMSSTMHLPCPYVYEQQPGLVPYQGAHGWHPSSFPGGTIHCTGNANDCQHAEHQPLQPGGVTFAWTQSLLSGYHAFVGGSCDIAGAPLNYPGAPKQIAEQILSIQGQHPYGAMYACNNVVDPVNQACEFEANPQLASTVEGLTVEQMRDLVLYPTDPLENAKIHTELTEWMANLQAPPTPDDFQVFLVGLASKSDYAKKLYHAFLGATNHKPAKLLELFAAFSGWSMVPSATEDMLSKACEEGAMSFMSVSAAPLLKSGTSADQPIGLQGAPYPMPNKKGGTAQVGSCDHIVFLESCDTEKDLYTIWTWGTKRFATKRGLLGAPATPTKTAGFAVPDKTGVFVPEGPYTTGMVCSFTIGHLSVEA